jgi:hypothetical protein
MNRRAASRVPRYVYLIMLNGALGGDPPVAVFTDVDELKIWLLGIDPEALESLACWRVSNGTPRTVNGRPFGTCSRENITERMLRTVAGLGEAHSAWRAGFT